MPSGNNGADGVIDPDNTMQKALGYNGPKYNGGYASVAMDEFLITDAPMTQEEIIDILNLADQLKYDQKHGIPHHLLEGKTLVKEIAVPGKLVNLVVKG